jgi:lipid-A-disaccharide synthase
VDHAALIFPFEERLYKKFKISSTYVGNPLMDVYPESCLNSSSRPGLLGSKRGKNFTIGLLPGSRTAEINNLLDIMIQAAEQVHLKNPRVEFLVSRAGSIRKESIEKHVQKSAKTHLFHIHDAKISDLFLKSDLVIAASGTVTLEAALCCVPTIIVYKMSSISYGIARLVVRVKYAGLANLIAGSQVMPELLQNEANPLKISQKVLHMLDHLDLYQARLLMVRKLLGNKGASRRTAKISLQLLNESGQQ